MRLDPRAFKLQLEWPIVRNLARVAPSTENPEGRIAFFVSVLSALPDSSSWHLRRPGAQGIIVCNFVCPPTSFPATAAANAAAAALVPVQRPRTRKNAQMAVEVLPLSSDGSRQVGSQIWHSLHLPLTCAPSL